MKVKKIMLFAGAALVASSALVLTSCSDSDDPAGQAAQAKADNTIAFQALTPTSTSTRATGVTPANFFDLMKGFKVWGYFADGGIHAGKYLIGEEGIGGILIDGNGKGSWVYRNSSDEQVWPDQTQGSLNFYALTPAEDANYSFNGSSVTYKVPTDQSKQVDLMLAQSNNQTKATNNGVVALNFQHQLAQVRFTGVSTLEKTVYEVKSVSIANVVNSGNIDMKTLDLSLGTQRSKYTAGLASPVSLKYNKNLTPSALNDADGNLLLFPQTLTKWENTKSNRVPVSDADAKGESYLVIQYRAYNTLSDGSKSWISGSESSYITIYLPISAIWKAGNIYTYNLKFGTGTDGFDPDGGDNNVKITYTVSVSDWNTVDPENLDM